MSARQRAFLEKARAALERSLRLAASPFRAVDASGTHGVHEARKELKRSASLARGFGRVVGIEAFAALEAANHARRAFGRTRDLDVLATALDKLKIDREIKTTLTRAIALERGAAVGDTIREPEALAMRLEGAAEWVRNWDLSPFDDVALVEALRHTFKLCKRRGAAAFASEDADDLHELRKGVIDLSHQLEEIKPSWPAMIEAQIDELRKLRQALGDFNDLTLIGEFALQRRDLDEKDVEAFVEAVRRRRRPHQRKAHEMFERAFAERPTAFGRRLLAYVENPRGRD